MSGGYSKKLINNDSFEKELKIKRINHRLKVIHQLIDELQSYRSTEEEIDEYKKEMIDDFLLELDSQTRDYFSISFSENQIETLTLNLSMLLDKISYVLSEFRYIEENSKNLVWKKIDESKNLMNELWDLNKKFGKHIKDMKKTELKQLIKECITELADNDSKEIKITATWLDDNGEECGTDSKIKEMNKNQFDKTIKRFGHSAVVDYDWDEGYINYTSE